MKHIPVVFAVMASAYLCAAPFDFVEARRTAVPVKIDGELEDIWLDRANVYNMRHYDGRIDNPLCVENYLTMLRLLWDERYLYVSYVCSGNEITANFTKRDDPLYREDICEVVIKLPESRYHLELSISPKGVIYDALFHWDRDNKINVDTSYTLNGLQSAVRIRQNGDKPVWTVELAIPWSAVKGFEPRIGAGLNSNFLRYEQITAPELKKLNNNSGYLPLSVFPTGIRGWPAGPSSLRPLILAE